MVICSDSNAGGKKEISYKTSELTCDVTTDPEKIAQFLNEEDERTKVLFCTYQSLWSVIDAQRKNNAPDFDLTICDEAHRTTGIDRSESTGVDNTGFKAVHRDLTSKKRLYMTATERIYTTSSKKSLKKKEIKVIDMEDIDIYGKTFYKLKFKDAVDEEILSDYRVIAMGFNEDFIPKGLRDQLLSIADESETQDRNKKQKPLVITNEDLEKVIATSLAINGILPKKNIENPDQLYRSIVFANTIKNSKYFAEALDNSQLKRYVTKQKEGSSRALKTEIEHLDASDNAYRRRQSLEKLRTAKNDNTARALCNVGLFGEGIDVPALDAIVFIEPRKSQIDIVQAVGRVMRKAEGKKLGYIIVPVPIASGETLEDALAQGTKGYEVIGQVLRALQSHDERLAKNTAQFVEVGEIEPFMKDEGVIALTDDEFVQGTFLKISEVADSVYAQIVSASGLGKPGKLVTDQISYTIDRVTDILTEGRSEATDNADFIYALAKSLGEKIDYSKKDSEKNLCKIGALLIANACILQKRIQTTNTWKGLLRDTTDINLDGIEAIDSLKESWQTILAKDYKPVFEPALAVLDVLPRRPYIATCIHMLIECANNVADELTDLGYDHAGSLYHKIMPHAKETGAYYTNNLSALLLVKLSIKKDFVDWHNEYAISQLKIMDVACGTGTLLMASVKVMKEHFAKAHSIDLKNQTVKDKKKMAYFHQLLVENVIHGLDINQCAVQLSASNLTLGSPNVDYNRMNLHTLKQGIQPNGNPKAGSLDILNEDNQMSLIQTPKTNTQVNDEDISFPTKDIDMVIMNPPFKNNEDRNSQYSDKDRDAMRQHEKIIKKTLTAKDKKTGDVIDFNSIRTFFTPIADKVLNTNRGVLSKIIPVTACISSSGLPERKFLAQRFHIERIIVSHDPKRINFSENTSIHECLFIGRRHSDSTINKPTEFISLKRMPKTPEEVEEVYQAIENNTNENQWITKTQWSADLMKMGDWTPVQWLNGKLPRICKEIESSESFEPMGDRYSIKPQASSIRTTFERCDPNDKEAKPVFWSISSKIRTTMLSKPDSWQKPKANKSSLAQKYWDLRSNVLISEKMDTQSGRLVGVYSNIDSVGSAFMSVSTQDEKYAKGLVAWWNSTPCLLMLLNARTKKMTYPQWSLNHLLSIKIPKPDNPAWNDLYQAFEATKNKEMLTLKDAEKCQVRKTIDKAAAKALGIPEQEIAQWRSLLAKEPTISNKYADEIESQE